MKEDVIERIKKNVSSPRIKNELIQKVMNDEELTPNEVKIVYGPVDFGEVLPMVKKKELDIDWTDHAEYRSDLRGIDPEKTNENIRDKIKQKYLVNPRLKEKREIRGPAGKAVVDYNTYSVPAEAEVVTTYASNLKEIKFSSTNKALQFLSDYTNQRIIISL